MTGERYHNPQKKFTSYFLTFPRGGVRLEIMNGPEIIDRDSTVKLRGYSHIAISLGSKERVDETTELMRRAGIAVVGAPRTIGDSYYESVEADPDGNLVVLSV